MAHAVHDPIEFLLHVRVAAQGIGLRQLMRPARREEVDGLLGAMRNRTLCEFDRWLVQHEVPDHEARRALLMMEEIAQRDLGEHVRACVPLACSVETGIALVSSLYEGNRLLQGDIVARDIGAKLMRAAFRSAGPYVGALRGLDLGVRAAHSA